MKIISITKQKIFIQVMKQLAYDEGVDAGVEQNKIEMIKNLKDKLSI